MGNSDLSCCNYTLGELGQFRNGVNFSQDDYGTGIPIVNVKQLYTGRYVNTCNLLELRQSAVKNIESVQLRNGDILFARSSVKASGAGQVAMISDCSENTVFSGFIIRYRIEATDKISPLYLCYLLRSPEYRELLTRIGSGTTITNLSQETLGGIEVCLPALSEQHVIAHILGTLDDKIELNRKMSETLETMARVLFKSWFVDFEPVRAKAEGRAPGLPKEIADLYPDSFEDSELGEVPKGWRVGTVDEATSLIIDYRGKTPKKLGHDWSSAGIPAISAKNVKSGRLVRPDTFNYVSNELYEKWMKDKLAIGDVLLTSEAPLGELCYLAINSHYCLSQRVFALRANSSCCESTFLYYWLESPSCQSEIINRGTGTTVEGIRQTELRKVKILLPPMNIQRAAAKLLNCLTEKIHRNEMESRILTDQRDALLPKLLSGEIRLNGQNN